MKKISLVLFFLLLIFSALPAEDAISLYIEGLESLTEDNNESAEFYFKNLVENHPESPYSFKAQNYLNKFSIENDNSGLVRLYFNNMLALSYSACTLPLLFDSDNNLVYGFAGLAGLGLGAFSSYMMSKNNSISSSLEWWVTSSEIVAFGNYLYLSSGIGLAQLFKSGEKVDFLGRVAVINSSLFGSFYYFKDKEFSKDKCLFGLQSYLWANYYYFMVSGMLEGGNEFAGMLWSDAVYAGSFPLWDKLQWSSTRTNFITVGGMGGILAGGFTTLILGNLIELNNLEFFGIFCAGALAGQITAVLLTKNIPDKNEEVNMGKTNSISVFPVFTANKELGVSIHCYL